MNKKLINLISVFASLLFTAVLVYILMFFYSSGILITDFVVNYISYPCPFEGSNLNLDICFYPLQTLFLFIFLLTIFFFLIRSFFKK